MMKIEHRFNLSVFVWVCILTCVWLVLPASSATYYVATNGKDTNVGTSEQPFQTIQKAANIVKPGDKVIVRNGVYPKSGKNMGFAITRSGTAEAPITFKSEHKWGAVIDGTGEGGHSGINIDDNVGFVRIEEFEIKKWDSGGISAGDGTHHIYHYGNHIHHIGNICTDTKYGIVGFRASSTSYEMTYDSNLVHDIGRRHPEDGCNYTTQYYKNHDHGIYAYAHDVIIINNVFYNQKSGWAIQTAPNVRNWLISNNTFAFPNSNRDGHIILWGANTNITIQNNIFYRPRNYAIDNSGGSNPTGGKVNIVIRNNLIYGAGEIIHGTSTEYQIGGNMLDTNPLLVKPDSFDFHLTGSSPAIDAGVSTARTDMDFDQISRPQGASYDIGAYEFSKVVVVPPPANLKVVSGN